jgi:putative endopeptidase
MDRSVSPRTNFFQYANGTWVKNNPVPADKARWASFDELDNRNWHLVRALLDESAADTAAPARTPRRLVGDFYASAMDTNRIDRLEFKPLRPDLEKLESIQGPDDAARIVADWHLRGISVCFGLYVGPDAKKSDTYALHLSQGGLGLPDRDYYFAEGFAKQREEYRKHIATVFRMTGESASDADSMADTIFDLEKELAKASRSRTDLRDREKNYHKKTRADLAKLSPDIAWDVYFEATGTPKVAEVIVGQPEFFEALNRLSTERSPNDWLAYLRWHLIRSSASGLHSALYDESFRFYGTILQGQPQPEPRWQRAARAIDGGRTGGGLGEALGQLYVERHFPAAARARMSELVEDIKAVFKDRLAKLEWMSPATRELALKKFARFTTKIGHPEKFRDYSQVAIRREDYLGNLQRAQVADSRRDLERIGKTVDRDEWHMTPQTVNAYFNPTQNEIVFPAGILQPPFFDLAADDAVNYGAIGSVIGHEITHGYDDQGRKYDADGNLKDWWSEADAREFAGRADRIVAQYGAYEALPGAKVNGQLTLGENIADLGGTSIAFEALQRALARDPSKRRTVDGFTPEQRFFLAFAQAWRVNTREAEIRRRLVVDSHAPPQFRAFGPLVHQEAFINAFGLQAGDPLWKAPADRVRIW